MSSSQEETEVDLKNMDKQKQKKEETEEENKKDNVEEYNNTCCYCKLPCNPCSQACGSCLRIGSLHGTEYLLYILGN